MRVFVTGGTGYVGRYVVDQLVARGDEVTVLTRRANWCAPGVRTVVGDLMDFDRSVLANHEACIHAGIVWSEEASDWDAHDVRATARLFEGVGESGVEAVVYISSTAVHRPFRGVMDETQTLAPVDPYAATKVANEAWLSAASQRFGFKASVIRVGPVVGRPACEGGEINVLGRFHEWVKAASNGLDLVTREGEGRQFIAAADVAAVIVAAIGSSGVFLAASEEAVAWAAIARWIVERCSSTSRIVFEPGDASGVARFDVTKLAEAFGFRLNAEAAIRETIDILARRRDSRCGQSL